MTLPQDVAERMVKLDDIGPTQYKEFIEERLKEKKTPSMRQFRRPN